MCFTNSIVESMYLKAPSGFCCSVVISVVVYSLFVVAPIVCGVLCLVAVERVGCLTFAAF